jgi:hypothetical protein
MSDNILHCMTVEELGSDLSFEEFFRNMVEVLCGKREPLFRYERELRLCQLKIWLLQDDPDFISIRDAAQETLLKSTDILAATTCQNKRHRREPDHRP